MQNQETSQKPVQVDINVHQTLKEYAATSGITMGNLIKNAMKKDPDYREIYKRLYGNA